MDIQQAETLAKELIGLHCPNISFQWFNSKRCFGLYSHLEKKIKLSKPITEINSIEHVRDTILHEIAHALCPGEYHNYKWQNKCRELGAKPERCFSKDEVLVPKGKYQCQCPGCKKIVNRYKKKKRNDSACRDCCVKFNNGYYSSDYILVEIKVGKLVKKEDGVRDETSLSI